MQKETKSRLLCKLYVARKKEKDLQHVNCLFNSRDGQTESEQKGRGTENDDKRGSNLVETASRWLSSILFKRVVSVYITKWAKFFSSLSASYLLYS